MGDAVIVSAARTAIGTARKGSLVDVDVFELAKASIGEALKRSGIPSEDVDDIILGESLQGGGCVARYAAVDLGLTEVPGLAAQPPLRLGHGPRADGGGQHPGGHGPRRHRRRRREHHPEPAGHEEAAGHVLAACSSGCRRAIPATLRRADDGHVDHRRRGTPPRRPTSRARSRTTGPYHSHQRAVAAIDEGRLQGRDLRDAGARAREAGRDAHLRHRRAPAPRHHDGEAGDAPAAAPGDRGLQHHRGQLVGAQRRRLRRRRRRLRLRPGRTGSSRWRSCGRGRRWACRPPTPGSRRRSRSRRRSKRAGHHGRRSEAGRDQRGVRVDGGRELPHPRPRRTTS